MATGSVTCGSQKGSEMLCGGGSGVKIWIRFLPAISPEGTDRKTPILSSHDWQQEFTLLARQGGA